MFLIFRGFCWVWGHLVNGVRRWFLTILLNFVVLIKFPFLLLKRMVCTWLKLFQFGRQCFSSIPKTDLDLWHCRLEQKIRRGVQKLSKLFGGVKLHISIFFEFSCDICAKNTLNCKALSSEIVSRKSFKFELVNSVVRVLMEASSLGGHRYVVSFIDSYNRFARAYLMKHKSEVLKKIRQFCFDEGIHRTFSSLTLRSDDAGEYDEKAFDEFYFAQWTKREMTAPYSPQQIGFAELRWQTVGNIVRCLFKQAELLNSFWVGSVDVAFYLTNHCLRYSLPPNKTSFESFYSREPNLSNFKVFG